MRAFLRKMNLLPYDLGMKHFYPLEGSKSGRGVVNLMKPEGWDLVRAEEGHLFIPEDRRRWITMCDEPIEHDSNGGDLPARAQNILSQLVKKGVIEELYSFGVGLAALEFHIKRQRPELRIYCSDYGEETTQRLRKLFIECEGIEQFDLNNQRFREVYPNAGPEAVALVHRVDPHLTDQEWRRAFAHLAADGVRFVLFVPHRLLTLRYLIASKRREIIHRTKGTPLALSGNVRTLVRWERLWGGAYDLIEELDVGYGRGFWLELPR